MKQFLTKFALVLGLVATSTPALSAPVFLLENDDGDVFYYDDEFDYSADGITVTMYVEHAEVGTTDEGNGYDVTIEDWTYDCSDGTLRVDDEFYYFNDELVGTSLGIGEWEYVQSGTVGEDMQSVVCS